MQRDNLCKVVFYHRFSANDGVIHCNTKHPECKIHRVDLEIGSEQSWQRPNHHPGRLCWRRIAPNTCSSHYLQLLLQITPPESPHALGKVELVDRCSYCSG